uniref:Uncharacterized protein n=1 Tax=Romanomermis culicivorax TaxID=13658 RepID=A0A915L8K8_ROMCU
MLQNTFDFCRFDPVYHTTPMLGGPGPTNLWFMHKVVDELSTLANNGEEYDWLKNAYLAATGEKENTALQQTFLEVAGDCHLLWIISLIQETKNL